MKKPVDIESLFYEYRDKGYAFFLKTLSNPELAKDMIQDVFLKILEKDNLSDVEHWSTYFYTMCRNLAYDYFKKANHNLKYKEHLFHYRNEILDSPQEHPIEKKIDIRFKLNTLNSILESLSYQQQMIFYLNKKEGLSYKDIATKLNIAPNTVRNHLHRALKKIRAEMSNEY